jgi:hypothetical protein
MNEETTTQEKKEAVIPSKDVAAVLNNYDKLEKIVKQVLFRSGLRTDEKRTLDQIQINVARFRNTYFPKK